MIRVYVELVRSKRKTLKDVPAVLRDEVKKELESDA